MARLGGESKGNRIFFFLRLLWDWHCSYLWGVISCVIDRSIFLFSFCVGCDALWMLNKMPVVFECLNQFSSFCQVGNCSLDACELLAIVIHVCVCVCVCVCGEIDRIAVVFFLGLVTYIFIVTSVNHASIKSSLMNCLTLQFKVLEGFECFFYRFLEDPVKP